MTRQGYEILSEEEKYYALSKTSFHILAPFYDTGTKFISNLRDTAVDFANANKGSRILDIATGTGKQAFAFGRKGYDVTGIDLSEDMLKIAKKKNKYANVKFEIANAANLPFENNTFDVSTVSFALHDMIPSIREKALKEMVRVTRPKGTIMIIDYALPKNRISRFLVYHFIRLYEKYYSGFIRSDLKTLLKKAGVETEDELPVLYGVARIIKGTKLS